MALSKNFEMAEETIDPPRLSSMASSIGPFFVQNGWTIVVLVVVFLLLRWLYRTVSRQMVLKKAQISEQELEAINEKRRAWLQKMEERSKLEQEQAAKEQQEVKEAPVAKKKGPTGECSFFLRHGTWV